MAIGGGDTARCRGCDTEVAIPGPYLALRAAARLDERARARAESISTELARPPSLLMRFWQRAGAVALVVALVLLAVWLVVALAMSFGTLFSGGPIGALIMLLIGLFLGIPLLYNMTLHGLAEPLRVDLADVWGSAGAYALLGLACWVVTVVPFVLAAYADSFESVRTALRTALAARPAAIAGGAEQCRVCGAPLDERADQLHARCVYCGADNLVHLAAAPLSQLEDAMKAACTDLESAIAEESTAARRGRRLVATRLAKWLALVPMAVLLGRCVDLVNEDDVTFWQRAAATAPMLPSNADNPALPRGIATVFDVHRTFDGCDDDDCWAHYYVALAAGESPRLAVERGDLRVVEVARRTVGSWHDPTYEWRPTELMDGAPYAGWYRVKLATPKRRDAMPIVTWDAGHPP